MINRSMQMKYKACNRMVGILPSLCCNIIRSSIHLIHHSLQLLLIIISHILKSLHHFTTIFEPLMILGLPRRRNSRQSPSMKTLFRSNNNRIRDPPTVRMLPRQFDRTLIRLGTTIAKERLVRTGVFADPCRELSL